MVSDGDWARRLRRTALCAGAPNPRRGFVRSRLRSSRGRFHRHLWYHDPSSAHQSRLGPFQRRANPSSTSISPSDLPCRVTVLSVRPKRSVSRQSGASVKLPPFSSSSSLSREASPTDLSSSQRGEKISGASMSAILILPPLNQNVSPSTTQLTRTGPSQRTTRASSLSSMGASNDGPSWVEKSFDVSGLDCKPPSSRTPTSAVAEMMRSAREGVTLFSPAETCSGRHSHSYRHAGTRWRGRSAAADYPM